MAVKTISGSSLVMSVDLDGSGGGTYATIGGSTTCTLSVTQDTIDTTNKDSSGNKAFINGARGWTMDAEAFFTQGSSDGETVRFKTLNDAMQNGTRVKVKLSTTTGQTGVVYYDGFGYITSLSVGASVGEWSTYSISVQGDGALTTT
tara:strand:- start:7486 stop:7926 length:441 start_codon:yes stop_codon:yes gene_type:complete